MFSETKRFVVEELEQRRHLAGTPLSVYGPLTPGSQWVYNEVDNGVRSTSTETIGYGTVRIHGQRAFQDIEDDSDGRSIALESITRSGAMQLHRVKGDDYTITFNPPVASPTHIKPGQRVIMEGELDVLLTSTPMPIRMKGEYHMEMLIVGKEQVRVAAGTFSTEKAQMKLEFSAEYHKGAIDVEISSNSTGMDWSAKGVGSVKSISNSRTEAVINEKHKVFADKSKSSLRSYTIAPG